MSNDATNKLLKLEYSDLYDLVKLKTEQWNIMQKNYNLFRQSFYSIDALKKEIDNIKSLNLHPTDQEVQDEVKQSHLKAVDAIEKAKKSRDETISSYKDDLEKEKRKLSNNNQSLERWQKINNHRLAWGLGGFIVSLVFQTIPFIGGILGIAWLVLLWAIIVSSSKVKQYTSLVDKNKEQISDIDKGIDQHNSKFEKEKD
jgi:hypothetical protein